MQILDGRLVAQKCKVDLKKKVSDFVQKYHKQPRLVVILIGENPASQVYVRQKVKSSEEVGIQSELILLPADISLKKLKQTIHSLNQNPDVHAILVQLPLPLHLPWKQIISWIYPHKDPDCLTVENQGLSWLNQVRVNPCTPFGIIRLLEHYDISFKNKNAVVVGRSQIVGLPMAQLLLRANSTVTVCHSHTQDVSYFTKQADIVVVAAGRPEFLGKADFKKGAVVVDVGIHRVQQNKKTKLIGDVRFSELHDHVAFATPVPGGVGPMTVTMLLENTFNLAVLGENSNA